MIPKLTDTPSRFSSNQLSTTFIAIFIIFAGFTFYMNAHYLTFAFLFISFKD